MIISSCSKRDNQISVLLNPKQLHEKLDPKETPFTNDFYLLENLLVRLFVVDEEGNYQPQLVSKVEKKSDLEYLFKLKSSQFSNGDEITANDVKLSFERSMRLGTSHLQPMSFFERIVVVDQKTLNIKLKAKVKNLYYYLSLPDLGILHMEQVHKDQLTAEDFTKSASGPFSYREENGSYFFIKNKGYSLSPKIYPDKIKLLNYFKEEPHKQLLEGKADLGKVSVNFYLENLEKFQEDSSLKTIGIPSSSITYLYINENSKEFMDESHRAWLKYAIQNQFEVPSSLRWFARPTRQYFPPESKAYLSEQELEHVLSNKNKLEKPKDFPDEITIHTYTTVNNVTVKSLVDQLEKNTDVKVKIVADVAPSEYVEKMKKGQFGIFLNIMSSDFKTSVESINFEFFSRHHPLNDKTGLIKSSYDKYQRSETMEQEVKALKQISTEIIKSNQVIPLFHSAIPYVYNSEKIDFGSLNHAFVFNLWKIKVR